MEATQTTSTLNEVTEKSTVEFPKSISLKEAEDLLKYIAKNTKVDIHYNMSTNVQLLPAKHEDMMMQKSYCDNISGTLYSLEKLMTNEDFVMKPNSSDNYRFKDLKFFNTPGWELSDYRKEAVQLWDDVRKVSLDYFKQTK